MGNLFATWSIRIVKCKYKFTCICNDWKSISVSNGDTTKYKISVRLRYVIWLESVCNIITYGLLTKKYASCLSGKLGKNTWCTSICVFVMFVSISYCAFETIVIVFVLWLVICNMTVVYNTHTEILINQCWYYNTVQLIVHAIVLIIIMLEQLQVLM